MGGEAIGNTYPQSSVPACLTFTAHNHRRVWGAWQGVPHHHRVCKDTKKKKKKTKAKKITKIKKKKKEKSSPGLCSNPQEVGDSMHPGFPGGPQTRWSSHCNLAVGYQPRVWPCGRVNGTGQGVPRPTPQGQAWAWLALQVQASGPSSTCLSSVGVG